MIRRLVLGALALAASILAGCGDVIDALPHWCPEPGETCPVPVQGDDAVRAVGAAAVCPGDSLREVDARVDGSVEWACVPPGERTWRIVVGAVVPGWGAVVSTDDGGLVVCDANGRVVDLLPLVEGAAGRLWHALGGEDLDCLDSGACRVLSALCGGAGGVQ